MIRKKSWFPIAYMFFVTAFFSSIVIGLARVSDERVKANEKLALERAVLSVLPGVNVKAMTRPQIHDTFTEMISEPDESSNGAYMAKQNGQIIAYIVPMTGQGFWAPIKGVIGIKTDKKTILGWPQIEDLKEKIRRRLKELGMDHATIEIEREV